MTKPYEHTYVYDDQIITIIIYRMFKILYSLAFGVVMITAVW